jgi:hypothetical protein
MNEEQIKHRMVHAHQIMEAIVELCRDCRHEFVERGVYKPKEANDIVFSAMMSAVFTMIVRDLHCEDPQIIAEAMRDMDGLANNELNRLRQKIVDAMKTKESMN